MIVFIDNSQATKNQEFIKLAFIFSKRGWICVLISWIRASNSCRRPINSGDSKHKKAFGGERGREQLN